tara:strand:- start:204 stop:650 length:447 start_codon:yes stop_codon:yes gene_type:complete
MDIENIFGLFEDSENFNKEDKDNIKSFKSSPLFKVGMFKKLVWNGNNFRGEIIDFFSKSNSELEMSGVEDAGDYIMYTRAYFWIKGCDLKDEDWKDSLNHYAGDEIIVSIKLSIEYFESIEEFEKCALLKNIQDYLEKQELLKKLKET